MYQTEIDGIWAAEFIVPGDMGTGVVFLQNGLIFGGDTGYYYKGNFKLESDQIVGRVTISHHSGEKVSIFGPISSITMELEGRYGEPWIVGQLRHPANFSVSASVKLRRIERRSWSESK